MRVTFTLNFISQKEIFQQCFAQVWLLATTLTVFCLPLRTKEHKSDTINMKTAWNQEMILCISQKPGTTSDSLGSEREKRAGGSRRSFQRMKVWSWRRLKTEQSERRNTGFSSVATNTTKSTSKLMKFLLHVCSFFSLLPTSARKKIKNKIKISERRFN